MTQRRKTKTKESWALQLYREIQADKKNWPPWMHDHLKALREHQDRQRARRAAEQKHEMSGSER